MNHCWKGGISWLAALSPRKRHIPRFESLPLGMLTIGVLSFGT